MNSAFSEYLDVFFSQTAWYNIYLQKCDREITHDAQLERRQICFFFAKVFVQRGTPRARVRIVKFNAELKNTQIE